MGKQKKWTEAEIKILRDMFNNGKSDREIGETLNRKPTCVKPKRMSLGLTNKNRWWNEDEDNIVIKNYGNMSTADIAKLLPNRTVNSVQNRINQLGIGDKKAWSNHEDSILIKLNKEGLSNQEISNNLPNRSKNAITLRKHALGLKNESLRWAKEEEQFLIDNRYNMTMDEICTALSRTKPSVANRCSKLNIYIGSENGRAKSWDSIEDDYLFENYMTMSNFELAENLNCTVSNVRVRLNKLNLRRIPYKPASSKFEDWELDYIIKTYPSGNILDMCEHLNRTEVAIQTKANRIGVFRDIFWSKDEENFIIDNYLNMSDIEMSKILNKELSALSCKRNKLGCVRVQHKSKELWTEIELDELYDLWTSGLTDAEISHFLKNRDADHVKSKRLSLDWVVPKHELLWSDEEISILKLKYYDTPKEELEKHLPNRTWLAIMGKARKLNLERVVFENKNRRSSGEIEIKDVLDLFDINYKEEYSFEDLKYKNVLRFDFAIFDKKYNLKFLCEYDGRGHFEPIDFFGGQETYETTKHRDELKNKYCHDNNIDIIRIPYTDKNRIFSIVVNKLDKYNLREVE